MIREINIKIRESAEEVLKIQIPSYRVEAELIHFYELPPLKDTIETLQNCGETFYGYYLSSELAGFTSIKIEKGIIDIHRLVVNPKHFKKGIASHLIEYLEEHYKDIETIIVSTGSKNVPAVKLYEKKGFTKTGEIKIGEQLSVTTFKKSCE
jgi:ribosomal protein S18 acetylase RimI-like enzyme